jgi:hypothetical protein
VGECKPLGAGTLWANSQQQQQQQAVGVPVGPDGRPLQGIPMHPMGAGAGQGLTIVHFSAQRKRYLRDRGCIYVLLRVFRVYYASETAQVEPKSGRVSAPGAGYPVHPNYAQAGMMGGRHGEAV